MLPPWMRCVAGTSLPSRSNTACSGSGCLRPTRLISISWSLPGGLMTATTVSCGCSTRPLMRDPVSGDTQ